MYSIININKIFKSLSQKINFDFGKTKIKIGDLKEFKKYRDLGYTTIETNPQIIISPKLRFQNLSVIKAILMHEMAHFILIKQKRKHSERETDKLAEKLFKVKIYYNEYGIQNLKNGERPRPKIYK